MYSVDFVNAKSSEDMPHNTACKQGHTSMDNIEKVNI